MILSERMASYSLAGVAGGRVTPPFAAPGPLHAGQQVQHGAGDGDQHAHHDEGDVVAARVVEQPAGQGRAHERGSALE